MSGWYENSWERFNDKFRETEWERNDRLRAKRLKDARDKAILEEVETKRDTPALAVNDERTER